MLTHTAAFPVKPLAMLRLFLQQLKQHKLRVFCCCQPVVKFALCYRIAVKLLFISLHKL